METAIITVRVPKKLKEELKKHGVKVSAVVKKALEEELKRRKLEEIKKAAGELGRFFTKISDKEIVEDIRKMRELR